MNQSYRILYVGPFDAPWRTESLVADALREIGHRVKTVTLTDKSWRSLPRLFRGHDILLWTHRTNLLRKTPPLEQLALLDQARSAGLVTASYHLDRYWDLKREAEIHTQAWFRTDLVMTADGGNQQRFEEAGVNHRWVPPGVGMADCVLEGRVRPEFATDIAFVGSHHRYHPEWPWRRKLVEALSQRYGQRFRAYPVGAKEVRGQDLSDLYASAKVIVGDSCFASQPKGRRYFSDRVFETIGRGGFLLHPHVEGLDEMLFDDKHLGYFQAGEPDSLFERIEHYLARPDDRERIAADGRVQVRDNNTWRNRAKDMITGIVETKLSLLGWDAPVRPDTYDAIVVRETWLDDVYHARGNVHPGDLVVDLGANIGAFSIWAAKQGAEVIAVEVLPDNVKVLARNAELMGVADRITIRPVAVAEDERMISMSWFADDHSQSTYRTDEGHLSFPALPLSDLIPQGREVAFLKVDIEASEIAALGCADLSAVRRIGIETHNTPTGTTHEAIKAICRRAGFAVTETGGHTEGLVWGVKD